MNEKDSSVSIGVQSIDEKIEEFKGSAAKEADFIWGVDVFYGWQSAYGREKNVVEVTCKLDGQKFYYLLEDLRDIKQTDLVIKSLGSIALIKRSYIKHFVDVADGMIMEKKQKLMDCIDVYVPFDLGSLNALQHYRLVYRHFQENQEKFPSKISNTFNSEEHEGAILDVEYPVDKEGVLTIAFLREDFRNLFSVRNDNEYNQILDALHTLGVLIPNSGKKNKKKSEAFTFERALAKGIAVKYFTIRIDPSLFKGELV